MSQFKFNLTDTQLPLDQFATLTVDDNAGFVVGELVSNGTVTAKVSRLISTTLIVVKALKGGVAFAAEDTLTGAKSAAEATVAAFEWGQPRMRDVDGVQTEKMFGVFLDVDAKGVLAETHEDDAHPEVTVACRDAATKTGL